jgi:protein involved in ribonucleotide reduction
MSVVQFIEKFGNVKDKSHIRAVETKGSTTYGNHYTIDASEYDNSYFVALYIVKNKELIDTGYIYLNDILGVFEVNESVS